MPYRFFVAALVLGLLVTGCSGSGGSAPPAAAPTVATPTAEASPSPSPSRPTPAATAPLTGPVRVTAGMTRPGTRLRFGQRAIVPIRQYSPLFGYVEGVIGIVVQPIRSIPGSEIDGPIDDASAARLKRSRVYYVKIVITNESGHPMPLETPTFEGFRGDGESPDTVLIGGEVPGCEEVGATEFDHKGARWVTCDRWVSPPSAPIRQVRYLEAPYGEAPRPFEDARFNRYYNLGPITWR